jgi:PAS domain S-box-containing protein
MPVSRPEWWLDALERLAETALMNVAVVRWDGGDDAVVEWINHAGAALVGGEPEALIGRSLSETYPPELMAELLGRFGEARQTGSVTYEVVRELPTGRRTLHATTIALDGDRLLALAMDRTTDREAARRLEQVTELTRAGLYHRNVVDEQTTWSDELYRLLGYEPGEVAPDSELYVEHVHPEDRVRVLQEVSDARAERRPVLRSRHRIVQRQGGIRSVDLRAQLVSDPAGRLLYASGVVRDVTDEVERERHEELVRRATEHRQTALQVHDGVVQALSTVILALQLDELETARAAALEATTNAQELVTDLLGQVAAEQGGTLRPGSLRTTPVDGDG